MPSVNPGPATTQTAGSIAVLTPLNLGSGSTSSNPQGTNAIRCLAVGRAVSVGTTGDAAVLPVINSSVYNITNIVVTNSTLNGVSGSIATANISVNAGPGVTGTSINAAAALTTLTASNVVAQRTIVAGTLLVNLSGQYIYVNVGTAVVGGALDIFVYGYDLS